MVMAKVQHVVVDSGAFIRNAPVKDIGESIYTIRDVVSEIRDKGTRQRLQVLPYVINFQEPEKDSIRVVTDFTKKTGDYSSLSATDIRLIALTYQLEKRHVGIEHIKTVPDRKVIFNTGGTAKSGSEIAGFYVQKDSNLPTVTEQKSSVTSKSEISVENANDIDSITDSNLADDQLIQSITEVEIDNSEEALHDVPATENDPEPDLRLFKDGDTIREEVIEYDSSSEESESDSEDDGEGWITPSNVDAMNQLMTGVTGGEMIPSCKVGCLTTDFAMQNVLIQMGLNVISVDGMLIKKAKSYVLRCYSCFKLSTDVTRQFCHHCGNQTLRRLSVAINDDGTMQYFLSKKQFKLRKQQSIPLPRGGKHSTYPKLTEDQQLPQRRQAKQKHQHYGVFDPDYTANISPFAIRDTTSRSALVGAGRNFNKRNPDGGVRRRKK